MITIKSKDYGYIIFRELNLGYKESGVIDEKILILSELKSIESLYNFSKIELSQNDLEKIQIQIKELTKESHKPISQEAPIQTISVNSVPIPPDNNKNVNLIINSSSGSNTSNNTINIIEYDPENNVNIVGPEVTLLNDFTTWDNTYIGASVAPISEPMSEGLSLRHVGIDIEKPLANSLSFDFTTTTFGDSQRNILMFRPRNIPVSKVISDLITNAEVDYFYSVIFLEFTDNKLYLSLKYSHSFLGSDNISVNKEGMNLKIRFMNYLEAAILYLGMTLEDFINFGGQEAVDTYSLINLAVLLNELSNGSEELVNMLPVDNSTALLTTTMCQFIVDQDLEQEPFDISSKILFNCNTFVYKLPENCNDGDYLKINSNVNLLNYSLIKNDYFQLYDNKTKGIIIRLTEEQKTVGGGKFLGYLSVQPSGANAKDGDWFIKDTQGPDSTVIRIMYVWVTERYQWQVIGYVPSPNSNNSTQDLKWESYNNTIKNPNGYPTAGYRGVFSYDPPLAQGESSLYLNQNENKLKYSNGNSWYYLPEKSPSFLGQHYDDPVVDYYKNQFYYNTSTSKLRVKSNNSYYFSDMQIIADLPQDIITRNNISDTIIYNSNQYAKTAITSDALLSYERDKDIINFARDSKYWKTSYDSNILGEGDLYTRYPSGGTQPLKDGFIANQQDVLINLNGRLISTTMTLYASSTQSLADFDIIFLGKNPINIKVNTIGNNRVYYINNIEYNYPSYFYKVIINITNDTRGLILNIYTIGASNTIEYLASHIIQPYNENISASFNLKNKSVNSLRLIKVEMKSINQ